jgi:hypothetical protein
LGFVIFLYVFVFAIERQVFSWRHLLIFVPTVAVLPLFNPFIYFTDYFFVDDKNLNIKTAFGCRKIPAGNIIKLIYERRVGYHFLVIEHRVDGKVAKVEKNVEFFSTKDLNELNIELIKINSQIIVNIDEDSSAYQKKKANLHLKTPKNSFMWFLFGLKWFCVGLVIGALLLWLPFYINPSKFPGSGQL